MPKTYAETGNTPPRGQGPNDLDPDSYSKDVLPGRGGPSTVQRAANWGVINPADFREIGAGAGRASDSAALKALVERIAGGAAGRPKPAPLKTQRRPPPLGPARPAREAQQMVEQREAMQQPGRMPGSASVRRRR